VLPYGALAAEIGYTADGHPYIKNEMLIKVRSSPQLRRFLEQSRSSLGALSTNEPLGLARGGQWYSVRISSGADASEAALKALGSGSVLSAEPNYVYTTMLGSEPGRPAPGRDPDYRSPPRLPSPEVEDPLLGQLDGLRLIGAAEAWQFNRGSADVVVANIDTGIDYTHPDLLNNLWINKGEIPGNNTDDDGNGYVDDIIGYDFKDGDPKPFDDGGHGTHTAGTMGATGGNGIGVSGVAQRVSIMSLRFLGGHNGSGTTADAIAAIAYAASNGARLTSNSWGGGAYSQALFDAIAELNEKDILFVAAAGNASTDLDRTPSFPASYNLPNIIAVASTNSEDEVVSSSNFGVRSVLLSAPGFQILSTAPGRSYQRFTGTSMATPHVSGAAALLYAAYPGLTGQQVKTLLADSVVRIPALQSRVSSGGRLDVAKAFEAARAQFGPPR
jgi:subtilisin family serine protease